MNGARSLAPGNIPNFEDKAQVMTLFLKMSETKFEVPT